jgi:hypothetical protein
LSKSALGRFDFTVFKFPSAPAFHARRAQPKFFKKGRKNLKSWAFLGSVSRETFRGGLLPACIAPRRSAWPHPPLGGADGWGFF